MDDPKLFDQGTKLSDIFKYKKERKESIRRGKKDLPRNISLSTKIRLTSGILILMHRKILLQEEILSLKTCLLTIRHCLNKIQIRFLV
jgi:hypothetical protein